MEAEKHKKGPLSGFLWGDYIKIRLRNMKFTFRNVELVVCFRCVFYDKRGARNHKGGTIMTLGEKIAKQRKELNYTQEQLADILGVSRQSVSKWESDIAYPETDKLIELGKLFDCSMDYLLKEKATEKCDIHASGFTEKVEQISRKVMTDRNRDKAKRILVIIGIILAVALAIDMISMIIYFAVLGTPHAASYSCIQGQTL